MNTPDWVKPGLYGAAAGAVVIAIAGFSSGQWMTSGAAAKMASAQAQVEVVEALVPICVEQSKMDPEAAATLAKLKEVSSYQRADVLIKAGWATMPGTTDANHYVARACVDKLSATF